MNNQVGTPLSKFTSLIQEGISESNAGHTQQAIKIFKEIADSEASQLPQAYAYLLIASIRERNGELSDNDDALLKIVELNPTCEDLQIIVFLFEKEFAEPIPRKTLATLLGILKLQHSYSRLRVSLECEIIKLLKKSANDGQKLGTELEGTINPDVYSAISECFGLDQEADSRQGSGRRAKSSTQIIKELFSDPKNDAIYRELNNGKGKGEVKNHSWQVPPDEHGIGGTLGGSGYTTAPYDWVPFIVTVSLIVAVVVIVVVVAVWRHRRKKKAT